MPKQIVVTYTCDCDPLEGCDSEVQVKVSSQGSVRRYCLAHALEAVGKIMRDEPDFLFTCSACSAKDVESAPAETAGYGACDVVGCKSFGRPQKSYAAHMRKYHNVFQRAQRVKPEIPGQSTMLPAERQARAAAASDDPTL